MSDFKMSFIAKYKNYEIPTSCTCLLSRHNIFIHIIRCLSNIFPVCFESGQISQWTISLYEYLKPPFYARFTDFY
jgi:hypothetical protein